MSNPNQPKTVSANGVALVKKFEGLHKVMDDGMIRSYRCPAGKWTIGYGHTKGVRSGQKITEEQAYQFLREDLQEAVDAVRRYVNVPLDQEQMDALASWTHNLGAGNLRSSTMLKKLNQGDYEAVPMEMQRWNKATVDGVLQPLKGLTRRRTAEAAMFTINAPAGDEQPQPQKVVATSTKKPLTKSRTMAGLGAAGVGLVLSQTADQLQPFIPYLDGLQYVWVGLSVVGIALGFYARLDDHKKGIN